MFPLRRLKTARIPFSINFNASKTGLSVYYKLNMNNCRSRLAFIQLLPCPVVPTHVDRRHVTCVATKCTLGNVVQKAKSRLESLFTVLIAVSSLNSSYILKHEIKSCFISSNTAKNTSKWGNKEPTEVLLAQNEAHYSKSHYRTW